jgi:hypothetical protein
MAVVCSCCDVDLCESCGHHCDCAHLPPAHGVYAMGGQTTG